MASEDSVDTAFCQGLFAVPAELVGSPRPIHDEQPLHSARSVAGPRAAPSRYPSAMHPIERLRYVARAGDADPALLAEEAAEALGSLAREPRALVPACRRLLEFHPTCGPLWWVCARLLVADDLREAARVAVELLMDDPTADELAASLPAGATVAASASGLVAEALGERPDLSSRLVGSPSALRGALRRAGDSDVTGWDLSELDDALDGARLVVVDALAAGPAGYLLDSAAAALAVAAARLGLELWVAAGEGRILPNALFEVVVQRGEGLADRDEYDSDEDDFFFDLGHSGRPISGRFAHRAIALHAEAARGVVSPNGPAVPSVGLARSSCRAPAELLVPSRSA